ncbi:MAG: hypothetical protein OHK93_005104 [Ramalina farinacea]|uniref:DUF7730 domain-containing protein n=1 Tax=Ramalina farinacea TaxID=258253 RepID=A0AA43QXQ8_9LECA|nr:hypothetical protein [Ramalina farinacea]
MNQHFPFMQLPLELRFIIYKALLVKPDPIDCTQHGYIYMPRFAGDRHWSDHDAPPTEPHNLALLRTSRTIHAECSPFFYAHNTFLAPSLGSLLYWLQIELSACHRAAVARLVVYWDDDRPGVTMQVLQSCVGLRVLEIRFLEITPLGRGGNWGRFDGLGDLMGLRGIEGLVVRRDEGDEGVRGGYEGWETLVGRLEVVRGLRTEGVLGRRYGRGLGG